MCECEYVSECVSECKCVCVREWERLQVSWQPQHLTARAQTYTEAAFGALAAVRATVPIEAGAGRRSMVIVVVDIIIVVIIADGAIALSTALKVLRGGGAV